MKALVQYITRDAFKAIQVVSVFAVLGLLAPPLTSIFSVASGSAVTLITFVWPVRQSLQILIGSGLAVVALALITAGADTATYVLSHVMSLWLPVWLLVLVYKRTASLVLALETGVYLAIAALFLVYASLDDPAVIWLPALTALMPQFFPQLPVAELEQMINAAAQLMTGIAAGTALVGLYICILLGRSWLAKLGKAAPLATDFNGLRFDHVTALTTIMLLGVSIMSDAPSAHNALIVVGMAYVLPGLAVIHGSVARAGLSNTWLMGLYMLLIFAGQVLVPVLSVLGLVDTWIDLRARVKNRAQ